MQGCMATTDVAWMTTFLQSSAGEGPRELCKQANLHADMTADRCTTFLVCRGDGCRAYQGPA